MDDMCLDEKVPVTLNIPKEIWRIVDFLWKGGLLEEELFNQRGWFFRGSCIVGGRGEGVLSTFSYHGLSHFR